LTRLANACFHDSAFYLRPEHQKQVSQILSDPEASDNDKYVALTMLRNAEVSAKGVLPFCQDTGTATIMQKKDSKSGQVAATKRRYPKGFTKLIPKKTCGIHRTYPWICTPRKIPAATCRHKLIFKQ